MKKEYTKPQMEAIVIGYGYQLLAGSDPSLQDEISNNSGYAPELELDDDLDY